MTKIFRNLKWYEYILMLLNIGIIVLQVYFEMKLIDKMAELIGKVQYSASVASIWQSGQWMLIYSAIILAAAICSSALSTYISSRFAQRLRSDIFKTVNGFSQEEINRFSTASLITRSTNDVTQIQNTFQMMLRMGIMAPTMTAFSIANMVSSSAKLSWATAIAVVVMFVLFGALFALVVPAFGKIQKQTDKLNSVTRENLTGVRVVRAYNTEALQEQKFDGVNKDVTRLNLYTGRVMSLINPFMNLVFNGLTLAIYWLGAYLINTTSLQYQDLVAFTQYGMHILMGFMFLSMIMIMLPRAIVSGKRIGEVLSTKTKIVPGDFDGTTQVKGKVEFRNVSFRYPDAEMNVLEDVSFVANKGETIAFIGSTGSGKSTLVNLIPRFFDATYGQVLIDDVDVKKYSHDALNKKLGFVPQKGILFSGTVEDNVKYGVKNLSDENVKNSLKIAQADFVDKLDGGLQYEIAQGGTNVSGGQRQRLCIARAVAKRPEIYVFDDSFSALDYKTDKKLRRALAKQTKSATKIIVAQRVGTIMDADKIIVLDNGKMVGAGTHKELMENCKIYQEIALSQLSKEELQ
jgi:ATP-binding cassette subfamily B protein